MFESVFDFEDGDYIIKTSDTSGMDQDGNLMLQVSDNLAMDTESGELHITSSWKDDDDDTE